MSFGNIWLKCSTLTSFNDLFCLQRLNNVLWDGKVMIYGEYGIIGGLNKY